MARSRRSNPQELDWVRLIRMVWSLRVLGNWAPALAAALIVVVLIWRFNAGGWLPGWLGGGGDFGPVPVPSRDGYLLCSWNVENLFDDENDPKNNDELENWHAARPQMLQNKLDLLAQALLAQNGGRGPDILAIVEVENRRAVELLQTRLNSQLSEELSYRHLVHHDNITGRRIEPAVLTRLPVRMDRTRTFGIRRMLEAHIDVKGRELIVLVSHWTSRVTDEEGDKRIEYGRANYQAFLRQYERDPNVDMILCGDFNDTPDEPSLRSAMRAVDDPSEMVRGGDQPTLLNLMGGRDPVAFGTYRYQRRWQILDHILASPGLLDEAGWRVRPETVSVDKRPDVDGAPRAFGGPKTTTVRGPSDHRPVTVRLMPDPAVFATPPAEAPPPPDEPAKSPEPTDQGEEPTTR